MFDHLLVQEKTLPPIAGATVSVVTGFTLHDLLGVTGQIIGILSGLSSLGWVIYQIVREWRRR